MSDPAFVQLCVRGRGTRSIPRDELLLVSRAGVDIPAELPAHLAEPGDFVGVRYGWCWPDVPAALPPLVERRLHGTEKRLVVPRQMNTELAFLLGAYLSEGHTARANWSVIITNSVMEVLGRAQRAWASEFGLQSRITRPPDRCSGLVVSSKRLVEYMDLLGCGGRASNKTVPEVILRSTREHVLAFMQGAALDAYTTNGPSAKWGICLESHDAINQLQELVTRLGVLNAQIPAVNHQNGKTYHVLYAPGAEGQKLCRAVPFLEPDKARRAEEYLGLSIREGSCSDVVPGIRGSDLYRLIPAGRSGRNGRGTGRQRFSFLCDPRTKRVSRNSVERAKLAGAQLPPWLRHVLDARIHFAEVTAPAGHTEWRPPQRS